MEKMKVLILGSTGMLGHMMFNYLSKNSDFELYDLVFRNKLREESIICDITDQEAVRNTLIEIKPDYVINCIGVLIQGSNTNPSNAIYINSFFPHFLTSIMREINSRLIHISTDCVFSGKKGSYVETDYRDADDVYGRSKALGEIQNNTDVTIRTSIVGPEIKLKGEGLLHWFLNQSGEINGYEKAKWGGVTTLELSKAVLEVIKQNITGLIHLTNNEKISKYEMLCLFKETFSREDISVNCIDGKFVDKSLSTARNDFKYAVPSYRTMFQDMKDDMEQNRIKYYKAYKF